MPVSKIKRFLVPKKSDWRNSRAHLVLKKELSAVQREFRKQMGTLMTSAFAFFAALLWRDAMVDLIPQGQQIVLKFTTAAIVSVFSVFMIILISRMLKVDDKEI